MNKRLPLAELEVDILVHVEDDNIVLRFAKPKDKELELASLKAEGERLYITRSELHTKVESETRLTRSTHYTVSKLINDLSSEIAVLLASDSTNPALISEEIVKLNNLKKQKLELQVKLDLSNESVDQKSLITVKAQEKSLREKTNRLRDEIDSITNLKRDIRTILYNKGLFSIFYLDDESLATKLDLLAFSKVIEVINEIKANPINESKEIIFSPFFYSSYLKMLGSQERQTKINNELKELNLDNPFYPEGLGKITPFDHQRIGFNFHYNMTDSALFWEQRTGKSRTTIDLISWRLKNHLIEKALILAPVTVLDNWANEVRDHSDLFPIIMIGSKKDKIAQMQNRKAQILICSYGTISSIRNEMMDYLGNFDLMIALDESSKIKNLRTNRSQDCIEIGKLAKYRSILTGTPVTQHAHDLFSQFMFLDQGETFGTNYESFINKYFSRNGFYINPKSGALDEISDKVYKKATRFLRKDIKVNGKTIPPKLYSTHVVRMNPEQARIYKDMVEKAIVEIESMGTTIQSKAQIVLVQLLRLSQITSGFIKNVIGKESNIRGINPKLQALADNIEELALDKQLVVWSRFKHDCDSIGKMLDEMKITYSILTGDTPALLRQPMIDKFRRGENRIFISTAGTGGMGINLSPCKNIIYFANDYSLQNRLQSEDRTEVLGADEPCSYTDIVCDGTIDLAILAILRAKKSIADLVTKDNQRWLSDALYGNINDFLRGIIGKL